MSTFDGPEFERWFAAARDELDAARHNTDGAFHNVAVLHAEQAAQCALRALLHGAGVGEHAYGHGLVRLAEQSHQHARARPGRGRPGPPRSPGARAPAIALPRRAA